MNTDLWQLDTPDIMYLNTKLTTGSSLMNNDLIVKDNTLINSSYMLGLTEQRILLLSIAKARKKGVEITENDYISIHANEFLSLFPSNAKTVYTSLKEACNTLFRREFSYRIGNTTVRSHWLQSSKYYEDAGTIEILFAKELIPFISVLKNRFTSYFLNDVAEMTSVYAIRLYELTIAWKSLGKTPIFELEEFREKIGVKPCEYKLMSNFKARVLNPAIDQINEFSNLKIKYEQHKKGRVISGFSFIFYEKEYEIFRDPDTVDWMEGSSDNEKKIKLKQEKRKTITKSEAERMARIGESWSELLTRLAPNFYIKDL